MRESLHFFFVFPRKTRAPLQDSVSAVNSCFPYIIDSASYCFLSVLDVRRVAREKVVRSKLTIVGLPPCACF